MIHLDDPSGSSDEHPINDPVIILDITDHL
jgi:hypothetical protein